MVIQLVKIFLITVLEFLFLITAAEQKRVAISTMTRKKLSSNTFKSIEMTSLNLVAMGKLTTGRGGAFLYFKNVKHCYLRPQIYK